MISYDIDIDKVRTKLAKLLEGYGVRIQYSVFECRLDKRRFNDLYAKMFTLLEEEVEGSVRIYPLCSKCEKQIRTIGKPLGWLDSTEGTIIVI